MSPNQQFEQKKCKAKFHQCFRSKLIENRFSFFSFFLSMAMYKRWKPNMENLPISQVKYSLCLIYYSIFHCIMSNNSTETSKTDVATCSWRITNNTFYRPAKIILCIWRVGYIIFHTRVWGVFSGRIFS